MRERERDEDGERRMPLLAVRIVAQLLRENRELVNREWNMPLLRLCRMFSSDWARYHTRNISIKSQDCL